MTKKNRNAYFIAGGHGMASLFKYIFSATDFEHFIYFGVVDSGGSTGDILDLFVDSPILPMGDLRNTLANMASFKADITIESTQSERLRMISKLLNYRTKDIDELQIALAELQISLYGSLDTGVADFSAEFLRKREYKEMDGSISVGNILIASFMHGDRLEELLDMLDFVPENVNLRYVNNERLVQIGIDIEGNKYVGEGAIDKAQKPIPPLWHWTEDQNGNRVSNVSDEIRREIATMDNLIVPAGSVANTFDGLPKLGTELLSKLNIIRIGNFAVGPNEVHPVMEMKTLYDAGIRNIRYILPKNIRREDHIYHFGRYEGERKEILEWPEDKEELNQYLKANLVRYQIEPDEDNDIFINEIIECGMITFADDLIDFVDGNGVHHNAEILNRELETSLLGYSEREVRFD